MVPDKANETGRIFADKMNAVTKKITNLLILDAVIGEALLRFFFATKAQGDTG